MESDAYRDLVSARAIKEIVQTDQRWSRVEVRVFKGGVFMDGSVDSEKDLSELKRLVEIGKHQVTEWRVRVMSQLESH